MEQSNPDLSRRFLIALTIVLLAWAAYHAVGAYFGGAALRDDWRRSLVVLGSMALFVGFWWLMLFLHRRDRPTDRN